MTRKPLCSQLFITDIDNTLIGDDNRRLDELIDFIKENRARMGFGVATGRDIESVRQVLKVHRLPDPDVLICSVGSEMYFGKKQVPGKGWAAHIAHKWQREKIVHLLTKFDFLRYQKEETQHKFKVSYYMSPGSQRLADIHDCLAENQCWYNLIYSHDQYLDILPYRASKGKAIRFLSRKWSIPLQNFLVCGDSGNDEEMLKVGALGVVVGNYRHELKKLKEQPYIYFSKAPCAGGILEGLAHYQFPGGSQE